MPPKVEAPANVIMPIPTTTPEAPSNAVDPPAEEPILTVEDEQDPDSQRTDGLFSVAPALAPPFHGVSVEEAARVAGMKALRLTLSWEDLLRFRRPCLLELSPQGSTFPRYAVLRGISKGGAWIQAEDSSLERISREALSLVWFGGVWLAMPATGSEQALKPNTEGDEVIRLQEALALLGYWEGIPTGVYEEDTQRAVMAFQRDLHLDVDGIVGPKTRGVIIQLLGEDGESL
jgi:hypothetical protein